MTGPTTRTTRERQVLLHSKRPTWAFQPLIFTEAVTWSRAPDGGAGWVLFREPLGRGAVDGSGSAPLFSLLGRLVSGLG